MLILLLAAGGSSQPACQPVFSPTRAQEDKPRVAIARRNRQEQIKQLFSRVCVDYPPRQVLLRAFKRERILELWVQKKDGSFLHLKDYAICAISGGLGPKRRQGDGQIPEGFYRVTWLNPESNFLLSLKINYPNTSDRLRGDRLRPGGDVFIHGSCVTIGCLPLTDEWIEELYLIVLDSTSRYQKPALVQIFPARLDHEGMQRLKEEFARSPELVDFWRELQAGFLALENRGRPLEPVIDSNGHYYFRETP